MQKFTVLHISTFDTGGAAIAAKRLHLALLEQNIDSRMLFAKKTDMSVENSFEIKSEKKSGLRSLGYRLSRKMGGGRNYWEKSKSFLKGRATHHDLFSLPYSDFDFTKTDLFNKAHIIHLHWVPSLLDYDFFSKIQKPVVWTLHDMNAFTGGCHYSAGCIKYRTDCGTCPQLNGTKNRELAKSFLQYKNQKLKPELLHVVTPSDWMRHKVNESSLMGACEATKIFYSLDIDIFKPLDKSYAREVLNIPKDAKVVLFVSERLKNHRKGFDLLIDAIKSTNENILYCSIGDLGNIDKPLENFKHLGKLTDLYSLVLAYNSADVLVIPSREDNLPNVMLEALCCGTPVIAFENGGMQEIINHDFNGILVSEQSSKSLACAIETFFKKSTFFKKTSISDKARDLFAPEKQAEAYMQLYSKLRSKE